jgi:hypothetical protein
MEYASDRYLRAIRAGRLVLSFTRSPGLVARVHPSGERKIHGGWGLHVQWVAPEYRLRQGLR